MMGTNLKPSTRYHPQTNVQTNRVKQWLEGYLRNYVSGQQKTWIKWFHLGEFCYNNTFHMSIGMSPFKVIYGYDALLSAKMTFLRPSADIHHVGTQKEN